MRSKFISDPMTASQLRFAVGVTSALALAYGVEWPLAFLFPLFTALLLSMPLPKPTLKQGLRTMLNTLIGFSIGLTFAIFFVRFPLLCLVAQFVALFFIYYYMNRGGSFWLTLMTLLSVLLLPMLTQIWEHIAISLSAGLVMSAWLAVLWVWFAHFLVPDPTNDVLPDTGGFQRVYSPVAAKLALKSTLVAFPIASYCLIYSRSDLILTMIFAAIFTLKPDLTAGKAAGRKSLISTVLGGVMAMAIYWAIVAVPRYEFFLLIMFAVMLFVGSKVFSNDPHAAYYGSAVSCILVLINGGMGENADFFMSLVTRVTLISLAIMYIVASLQVLDRFIFNRPQKLTRAQRT
ncbi:DUF2955 domain-containing protein [Vibrio sp. qd031]|uniref:DUF2955 domain-containing protein n=1 Tax=Vibrio sp. qd031 TaxID=1603038 RepID=UPI000A10282C|nr:DUF2955 domain-containing protein [Vibrio sp. qd031]